MEEKNTSPQTAKASNGKGSVVGPLLVGLVVALILGWWVFPQLMLVEKKQPIAFNHALHVQDQGMDCAECHYVRDDGTFHGLPTTEDCAQCHSSPLGENPEEQRFVTEYVDAGREIRTEWLVYQKQPDNVFFSHTAHSKERCETCHEYEVAAELCNQCHINISETSTPPVYKENRLSGYSKDTMVMWTCENCHALDGHAGNTNASNACFVCHK